MEENSSVGIIIDKPRTARVQRHRANSGATTVSCSNYYRINVYYPFIDHVITELEARFSCDHEGLVAVQYLVPFHLPQLSQENIDSLCSYYNKFLSYEEKEDLITDIMKWKKSYEEVSLQERPNTANSALASCSPQTFPTLHKVFTIFLTTPVGSVSCERSLSAFRRFKLWTRSSMKEERLAMMLIHHGSTFLVLRKSM